MRVDSTPSTPIRPIGTDVMLICTVVLPSGTDSVMVDIQLSGLNPSVGQLATANSNTGSTLGLDKICFFSCLFCFSFMLDKSTYFAFPITHFALSFTHFAFQIFLYLYTVIKVQVKIII